MDLRCLCRRVALHPGHHRVQAPAGGFRHPGGERFGHEVAAWDLPECDLTDFDATLEAVRRLDPRAVVNCAAYAGGRFTALRVRYDINVGAYMSMRSTTPINNVGEPWLESDQVAPLGAYGRTKLHGEQQVAAELEDHAIVRTAWLFGPHGPNFVSTMLRLASEREVSAIRSLLNIASGVGPTAPRAMRADTQAVRLSLSTSATPTPPPAPLRGFSPSR